MGSTVLDSLNRSTKVQQVQAISGSNLVSHPSLLGLSVAKSSSEVVRRELALGRNWILLPEMGSLESTDWSDTADSETLASDS